MSLIFWMSGTSGPQVPGQSIIPYFDKIGHFLVFGLMATMLCRLYPGKETEFRSGLFAIVATTLFGLMDETRQLTNPQRFFEWADWWADTAGAILAVVLYQNWDFYRNILEWSPLPKRKKDVK